MKILIITNGAIGDQIQFSSLIIGLKKKYKDSEITIFCHPLLKFIYKFDKNVTKVTSKISKEQFDIGFNFGLKNDLLDIFSEISIKQRIGFTRRKIEVAKTGNTEINKKGVLATNSCSKKLLVTVLSKLQSSKLLSEWLCEIAEVEWQKPYFSFPEAQISDFGVTNNIVLQYGTRIEEKNWDIKNYKDFINSFKNINFWITSSDKYKKEVLGLQKLRNVKILIDKSFYELANLLIKSIALISPDTAVAQAGIALNVNTIVLSCGFDRGFTLSKKYENLTLIEKKSMKDIKVEEVIKTLTEQNLLARVALIG